VAASNSAALAGTGADAIFGTPAAASAAAPAASTAAAAPAATGSGSLLGAAGALALPAAIFASYETTNPVNETAAWWNDMTNRINSSDPNVSNLARLTAANDYLNGGGDVPYTQAQLNALGITPAYLANISSPITSPAPGGKGWLGGGYTGASRA
jgi:Tfp pilus assembly protein FimV